ncbi:hypothetical protein H4Q26_000292 [Puccinia striiformis f. sp. tritici PST-130]|nr:hypothetical protein H4Q26_000292 [Puccinia striiformis f. sp. tritici PST-130]
MVRHSPPSVPHLKWKAGVQVAGNDRRGPRQQLRRLEGPLELIKFSKNNAKLTHISLRILRAELRVSCASRPRSHRTTGGSFDNAPGPMMNFPLYCSENNCRHRKLIQGALPETAAPPAMLPPIPDVMTRKGVKIRKPSPIESRRINDFMTTHSSGPFTLHTDGFFSRRHKPWWTLKYFCGKIKVFDDEDFKIYESGCCHCVDSDEMVALAMRRNACSLRP